MLNPRFATLCGVVLFAAIMRLVPHPWNFTPVAAMALFGGARFGKKAHAFLVPFIALILSDLVLGVYVRMPMVYFAFAVTVLIGFWLRNKNSVRLIATGVLVSSLSFFVITNFGVWAFGFAMQCMSTLAVTRRETGGWKVPLFMFTYMNVYAYFASLIVYQGGRLLGF